MPWAGEVLQTGYGSLGSGGIRIKSLRSDVGRAGDVSGVITLSGGSGGGGGAPLVAAHHLEAEAAHRLEVEAAHCSEVEAAHRPARVPCHPVKAALQREVIMSRPAAVLLQVVAVLLQAVAPHCVLCPVARAPRCFPVLRLLSYLAAGRRLLLVSGGSAEADGQRLLGTPVPWSAHVGRGR